MMQTTFKLQKEKNPTLDVSTGSKNKGRQNGKIEGKF